MNEQPNAYGLPQVDSQRPGPPQRTLNDRAQRGVAISKKVRTPRSNYTRLPTLNGGTWSGGLDRFTPAGTGSMFNSGADQNNQQINPNGYPGQPDPSTVDQMQGSGFALGGNVYTGRLPGFAGGGWVQLSGIRGGGGGGYSSGPGMQIIRGGPNQNYLRMAQQNHILPMGQPSGPGGAVQGFADGGDVDTTDYSGYDLGGLTDDQRAALMAQAQAAQQQQAQAVPLQQALGMALANNPVTTAQGPANQPQPPQETPGVTQPGTLLGQLQAERYNPNDPTAGNVAPDAAQKLAGAAATGLPMVGFGPVASAASMGLQDATEAAGAPKVVQDIAGLAPYMAGGIGELPTQRIAGGLGETLSGAAAPGVGKVAAETVAGGVGQYAGNQADKALGMPDLPVVGGPFGALGMMAGTMAPGMAEGAAGRIAESTRLPGLEFRGAAPDAANPTPLTPSPAGGAMTPEEMRARLEAQGLDPNDNPMIAASAPGHTPEIAAAQAGAARNSYSTGLERTGDPGQALKDARFGAAMEGEVQRGNVRPEVEPGTAPLEEPATPAAPRAAGEAGGAPLPQDLNRVTSDTSPAAQGAPTEPMLPNQVGSISEASNPPPATLTKAPGPDLTDAELSARIATGRPTSRAAATTATGAATPPVAPATAAEPTTTLPPMTEAEINARGQAEAAAVQQNINDLKSLSDAALINRANAAGVTPGQAPLDASGNIVQSWKDNVASATAFAERNKETGGATQALMDAKPVSVGDQMSAKAGDFNNALTPKMDDLFGPNAPAGRANMDLERHQVQLAGGAQAGAEKGWMEQQPQATKPGTYSYTGTQSPVAGANIPRSGPVSTAMGAASQLFKEIRDITLLPNAAKVMDHIPLLRQGGTSLFTDPVGSLEGVRNAAKAFVSEHSTQEIMAAHNALADLHIGNDPQMPSLRDIGVRVAQSGNVKSAAREGEMEWVGSGNTLASKLAENTPGIKNTERAYPAEMNTVRLHTAGVAAQAMYDAGIRDPAAYKSMADVINVRTGYGRFGNGPIPSVFSMRALSARLEQPIQLITKLGNPLQPGAYREVIKTNLANVALGGAGLAVAQLAGGKIVQGANGLPTAQWTNASGTAIQSWDPWAGANATAKLFERSVKAVQQGGSPGDVGMRLVHIGEDFARKELNPFNSEVANAVTGENWAGQPVEGKGMLGRAENLLTSPDELKNTFAPFWAESFMDGYKNFGAAGIARSAPSLGGGSVSEYPISTGSQVNAAHQDATQTVLRDDATRAAAFPNPAVAAGLKDANYKDLLPNEKQALLANASPETKATLDRIAEEQRQKGDPYQLSSDLYDQEHKDLTSSSQSYLPAFEQLQQRLFSGQGDPHAIEQAISTLRAQQTAEQKAIRDETTQKVAALNIPASTNPKSDAQQHLDAYRGLYDQVKGNSPYQDYVKLEQVQKAYLSTLDPAMAARIQEATKVDNSDKAPVLRFLDDVVSPARDQYFSLPSGQARSDFLRANPYDEAVLNVGGALTREYPIPVHSAQAAEYVHQLNPTASVVIRR